MQFSFIQQKKKWYYSLTAIAVILCLAGIALRIEKNRSSQAASANIPLVRTAAAGIATDSRSYTYPGEVRGRYESELSFQVGGKIAKRTVEIGSVVQAGDILMQLDPQDITQTVNSNSAQLAAAQARLKLAASDLSRYRQLYAQAAISRAQLDQYQNTYEVALTAVQQAEANYAQGSNQLGYTTLLANQPGVISAISAETGQVVSAGQTVLTLVRDGEREVEINVPENRVEKLRQAASLQVRFWALPQLTLQGRIREVSPVASSAARTYQVRLSLLNPPPEVKLGMTATVQALIPGQHTDTIFIPVSALYQTGERPAVWVVSNHTVALRPVTVGTMTNQIVEIMSGLSPGEIIVTAGVHKLQEGQPVRSNEGDQP